MLYKKDANWHQQIVHFPQINIEGHIYKYEKITNFCSYIRWFLWKLLIVIPVTAIVVGVCLGFYVGGWVNLIFVDSPSFDFFLKHHILWFIMTIVPLSLVGTISIKVTVERAKTKENLLEEEYMAGRLPRPKKGFLLTWYASVKEKYCPPVDY